MVYFTVILFHIIVPTLCPNIVRHALLVTNINSISTAAGRQGVRSNRAMLLQQQQIHFGQ